MQCTTCNEPALWRCPTCKLVYCGDACRKECSVFDIEQLTIENDLKLTVIFETPNMQVALMSIHDKAEMETHQHLTQFFRVEAGKGEIEIDGVTRPLHDGVSAVVPSGTPHEIRNLGDEPLKLYTIYAKNATDEWEH